MNFADIKRKVQQLKKNSLTVYFASRDPRLPLAIKILAIFIVAYAFSPIDFIPDFIPVLGLLDDLIIIPLGLALIIKLAPVEIIEAAKVRAEQAENAPVSYAAAVVFGVVWLSIIFMFSRWLYYSWIGPY